MEVSMAILQLTVEAFCFLLLLLLVAKLYEIGTHAWVARQGGKLTRELLARIRGKKRLDLNEDERHYLTRQYGQFRVRTPWPVTDLVQRTCSTPIYRLFRLVFQYHILMSVVAILASYSDHLIIVLPAAIILFLGIWIEISYILYYEPMMGYSRISLDRRLLSLLPNFEPTKLGKVLPQFERLRSFLRVFFRLLVVVVVSYVGIYSGIDTLAASMGISTETVLLETNQKRLGAFEGLIDNRTRLFDFLYFSIVTAATVGYGDIIPNKAFFLSRIAVATEIIAGFTLLTGVITTISITVSVPDTEGETEEEKEARANEPV